MEKVSEDNDNNSSSKTKLISGISNLNENKTEFVISKKLDYRKSEYEIRHMMINNINSNFSFFNFFQDIVSLFLHRTFFR